MKIKFKIVLLFISIIIINSRIWAQGVVNNTKEAKKDKILISVVDYILANGHFVKKKINDSFSKEVFNHFIDRLDPDKRFFTQNDINDFSKFKYKIDDQLKNKDLSFYNLVYHRFLEKIKSVKKYYQLILSKPFNFKKYETINTDFKKVPFASNEKQLIDYWRKQLKLQVLGRIKEKISQQDKRVKKDKTFKKDSFKIIEKKVRQEVLKDINDLYLRIQELRNSDWFSSFLNAVVQRFDPHTVYMSPTIKSRFDQEISGKLEGIGAHLKQKGIYIRIVDLVSGGPSWKQGELEAGDIILKVAQGAKKPVNIVGMRIDDAIKLIKGKKGTEVRLTVKKKIDGSIKVISIVRDVVELEDTFVKSSIVEKNKKKYAIINLPKFYIDFKDQNARDSAKDMEKEINYLKKQGIEGLIIDLRKNGGGSLKTAIEISGLFIKEGPVVQVKYRGQNPIIKSDTNKKIQWKGPLVILVDELSASASEIFTAAMQDYKRAVIIGGRQTYGKGTVQNIWPLNQVYKYNENLGVLKMTIQKFYRINGGSTQLKGVFPDISIPDKYTYLKVGERDSDDALPWDKISKANYIPLNIYSNFDEIVLKSKKRIKDNPKFKIVDSFAKWLKKDKENNLYSLNYKEFEKQKKVRDENIEKFKNVFQYNSHLKFTSPTYELTLIKKDSIFAQKRRSWHKKMSKDIYIDEALNVLSELKMKTPYNFAKK